MENTLKLTITAVGDEDSIFLTPCEPVTLHESSVERTEDEDADRPEGPVRGDGLPVRDEDVMLMMD